MPWFLFILVIKPNLHSKWFGKLEKILRNRNLTEDKYGGSLSCLAVGFEVSSPG